MPETALINNWVFAAFPDADQISLQDHMQKVFLPQGDVIAFTGDNVETAYFPVTAEIANVVSSQDGKVTTASSVGRDGVTGLAAFLADGNLGWDLRVDIAGYAWSLPAGLLRQRHETSSALAKVLLEVTHNNQIEAARNTFCTAHHMVTQRMARWLLTTQDRTAFQELPYTQEHLAETLGVRRTTVVKSSRELVEMGAISQVRGKTKIRDRGLLKSQACSCYFETFSGIVGCPG